MADGFAAIASGKRPTIDPMLGGSDLPVKNFFEVQISAQNAYCGLLRKNGRMIQRGKTKIQLIF
jgi:hypothetical protein